MEAASSGEKGDAEQMDAATVGEHDDTVQIEPAIFAKGDAELQERAPEVACEEGRNRETALP